MFESNRKNKYLIFCFLLIIPAFTHAQLRYEVVDGDTILVFTHPMKDKFDVDLTIEVMFQDSVFTYSYELNNSISSDQSIWYWLFFSEAKIFDISSPDGWNSFTGINPVRYSYSSNSQEFRVAPGEIVKSFSFKSHSLPTIQKYFMEGWEQIILEPGNEPDSVENESFFDTAKEGITIFPRSNLDITSLQNFTDTLETFRYRSCEELNWVTNHGVCNSLEVKVQNVKRHIERDQIKQAGNVLDAFLNEVEAQRGKHITEEGYALLYFNARYVRNQLNVQVED